ncbi:hypothetical protein LZ32DRAFT_681689, partial [Colletotrichum eremochloae]
LNINAVNNNETPRDISPGNSPSGCVAEWLRKCPSARNGHATPSDDQCRFEWPAVNRHEDNDGVSPATCIKNRPSAVKDDLKKSSSRSANCDMASGTCKPSPVHSCPQAKRSPDAPLTPEASITVRDSTLETGSFLVSSDSKLPSKRATFNERVEVRTSPTYWQREHSEGDGPYAQFRHDHYHEVLREGQKAVPLEDPLRDPEGKSAGQLYSPHCSVDEESFNSWSSPNAGCDAFAAPGFRHNFSDGSHGNQPHPNNLYTSKGYSSICEFSLDVGPSDFDKMRPSPSNRQHQLYSDDNFPCNQGKENQSCPTNTVALEESYSPFSSFEEHCCSGKDYQYNWSSRHDGPCASHANPPWCPEDPYSNCVSRSAQNYKYPGFSDSFHRDNDIYRVAGLNGPLTCWKDQEVTPDDRGFHQGSSDFDSTHQRYSQHRHSYPSDRQWACHDKEPFNIHEDSPELRPDRFPGCSADQGPDIGHDFPNDTPSDANAPFDSSSTSKGAFHEPSLPYTGCAMEIPDDMSDSDVHNLLIPGYDDYVPWRKTGSA